MSVNEIFERKTGNIKNIGIAFKYESRQGMINMYKEFRSTTLCGAVSQLYNEMAGRHSGRSETVHIIKTVVLRPKDCVRPKSIQFNECALKYPKITEGKRAPTAVHKATFTASRPTVI